MASPTGKTGSDLPVMAALMIGVLSAFIVGFSFVVIKSWPIPASVVPALGFNGGFWWGAVVGAISGLVIGFLTDETHFSDPTS